MKTVATVTIDGVDYQLIRRDDLPCGDQFVIQCAPFPKSKKTILQVAKELCSFMDITGPSACVAAVAEERIVEIERRLEELEK